MFDPEDYQNLINATGLSEVHVSTDETLQHEYLIWQRMYHSMGGQGSLPPFLMIPMLRLLGINPAAPAKPTPVAVDWRRVKLGARVAAAADDGREFTGEFCGIIQDGMLGVRLDGDDSADLYGPAAVRLIAADAPKQQRPIGEVLERDDADLDDVAIRNQFDPADPTGRDPGPKVARKWGLVAPGDAVTCTFRGVTHHARFIDEGPVDGKVTVYFDDAETTLDEADVEIGHLELVEAEAPKKPAAKRAAPRKKKA